MLKIIIIIKVGKIMPLIWLLRDLYLYYIRENRNYNW